MRRNGILPWGSRLWAGTVASFLLLLFLLWERPDTVVGQDDGDCIPDLKELRLRMDAEWSSELLFLNATRSAPYRYILCPNTVYLMESVEQQIVPILDQTFILCGSDGSLTNNCIVEERILNETAFIPEVALLRTLANYNRFLTVFSGITFDTSFGASVTAWDAYPNRVLFVECLWTGSRGLRVIDQQGTVSARPSIGEEAMIVQLDDCTIENEAGLEEGEIFDAAGTPLNVAIYNQGGTLDIHNITFRGNHLNYFLFTVFSRTIIRRSLFTNNQLEEGIFGYVAFVTVTDSRFEYNRYVVGSLSIADAAMTSRMNEFHGNFGLADVTVLSVRRNTRTPSAQIISSCFTDGDYEAGPILTAGQGVYEYDDVYVSNILGACPQRPFLESKEDLCFDDGGNYITNQTCSGTCEDDEFFGAEICALAPKPSAAPSHSPAPTKSPAPSFAPTHSPAPTHFPTLEPTTLSFAYGGTSSPSRVPSAPVPTQKPVQEDLQTANRASTSNDGANNNDGFCETGAGPFLCVGVPVIAAVIIVAVALVIVFHQQGGSFGGNPVVRRIRRSEVELPSRSDDDGTLGDGSAMPPSELS